MNDVTRAPFRLAIRAEGKYVNAYFASHGTMDGALLIGSILRLPCDRDRTIFDRWRGAMEHVIRVACTDALGDIAIDMIEEPAPEHERAGNA